MINTYLRVSALIPSVHALFLLPRFDLLQTSVPPIQMYPFPFLAVRSLTLHSEYYFHIFRIISLTNDVLIYQCSIILPILILKSLGRITYKEKYTSNRITVFHRASTQTHCLFRQGVCTTSFLFFPLQV